MKKTPAAIVSSLFVVCLSWILPAPHVSAAPLVGLNFNGQITNTGTTNADTWSNATPNFVPSTLLGNPEVLDFDGGQYLSIPNLTAGDLGITGGQPRTITVLAKVDVFTEGGLFDYGSYVAAENFSWRTLSSITDRWRVQLIGGADFDFSIPGCQGKWGLYTLSYDGTNVAAYYNGILVQQEARDLITTSTNVKIGDWNNNHLVGQMAEFQIDNVGLGAGEASKQFNQFAKTYGGFAYSFGGATMEDSIGEKDWLASCGSKAIRSAPGFSPTQALTSFAPLEGTNIKGSGQRDDQTGIVWGPIFTVLDESASISMRITGPDYALNLNGADRTYNGGAGVALWDVAEGKFIESTFRAGGDNNVTGGVTWYDKTIPLAGLEGKEVMLVALDRQTNSWAWFALDSISAPLGSVMLRDADNMHRVLKEWTFDTGWDGWYQVTNEDRDTGGGTPISGNGVPVAFSLGNPSLGMIGYIDSTGDFASGKGYVSSTLPAEGLDWSTQIDNQVGVLRSETFTLKGDVLEFMLGGWGRDSNLAFELMVQSPDSDDFLLELLAYSNTGGSFVYDYWNIKEYEGREAYLRLWDTATGGNGWIALDNIRMLDFSPQSNDNGVPEPATWTLLLLGLGAFYGRQRWLPS